MPTREHTNTCNAVQSALENIRDLEGSALVSEPPKVQRFSGALTTWKRGQELDHLVESGQILELAREWGRLYVMDGTSECDCDAKYVYVIARRWHRGHCTTAPAKVIARISADSYVVEYLTEGPGPDQQGAYRSALAVALDDVAYLEAMEVDYGPLLTS